MSTFYHRIAMQHEQVHEELNTQIVKRVIEATPIERLYLLGLTICSNTTESLFSRQTDIHNDITHCYILALIANEHGCSLNSYQNKIEGNLRRFLPVTAIVLSVHQFGKWLSEGHVFANEVLLKALLLFPKEEAPLPQSNFLSKEVIKNKAAEIFAQTNTMMQEFLAGAELYTVRIKYKMAAFMLHQAAEQGLRAILSINCGLRINTHSIDRLLRYCLMFCFELRDIFPRKDEKGERLFQLLQKAYIDTRYSRDYNIKLHELLMLTEQVKKLYQVFLKSLSDTEN